MWREAQHLCSDHCRAYHGVWQYLLLLDVIRGLRSDRAFLIQTLRERLRSERIERVLVSGTADYAMPACVLAAARLENQSPSITVVDRCATPLAISDWYARQVSADFETVQSDILEYRGAAPFDLICTHSFIARFEPEVRNRLLCHWRDLLRPGGWVLTSHRARPGLDAERVRYDDATIERFVASVRTAADNFAAPLGVSREDLLREARKYAQAKSNFNLRSGDEVAAHFTHNGFEIVARDELVSNSMTGDHPPVQASSGSYRVRLLARRI